ncbi:MAG: hypothetical protein MJB12_07965 [Firmicutes bacterium]|nr:hypothetical protein [Bacillota bacterium]
MLPDVVGYRLEKGKKILLDEGYRDIKVLFTRSPKHNPQFTGYHNQRIVMIGDIDDSTVELLVCHV